MRRLGFVFVVLGFLLSSCHTGAPPMVSDAPAGIPARPTARPGTTTQQGGCHEVHRVKCAVDDCKGTNMDYVMIRCQDGRELNRCVINSQCG